MKLKHRSVVNVNWSREAVQFSRGGSGRVRSAVSQPGVRVEVFGMIKGACVSISSVERIMDE